MSEILGPQYRVLEQVPIPGTREPRRAVLVGTVARDGILRATGLMVCVVRPRSGARAVRVLGATALVTTDAYDVSLAKVHSDLDGDGLPEVALDERVAGDGPRLEATTWFRLDGGRLDEVWHMTRSYVFRGRTEHRELTVRGNGELVETIRIAETEEGLEANSRNLRAETHWDKVRRRFAPARIGVLR